MHGVTMKLQHVKSENPIETNETGKCKSGKRSV